VFEKNKRKKDNNIIEKLKKNRESKYKYNIIFLKVIKFLKLI
jgi:hypothetical protein